MSSECAPYTVQCFLCENAYPIDEIRAHREVCGGSTDLKQESHQSVSDSDDDDNNAVSTATFTEQPRQ